MGRAPTCGSTTSTLGLAPEVRQGLKLLTASLRAAGFPAVVTSAYRSRRTQECLYQRYISGQSPYPAAKPGNSAHERGLAFDLKITGPPGVLEAAGKVWEQMFPGFVWGGRFRDPIHFEYRPKKVTVRRRRTSA